MTDQTWRARREASRARAAEQRRQGATGRQDEVLWVARETRPPEPRTAQANAATEIAHRRGASRSGGFGVGDGLKIGLLAAILLAVGAGDVILLGLTRQARDDAARSSAEQVTTRKAMQAALDEARIDSGDAARRADAALSRTEAAWRAVVALARDVHRLGRRAAIAYGPVDLETTGYRDGQGRLHWRIMPHLENSGAAEAEDLAAASGWTFSPAPLDDPWFAAAGDHRTVVRTALPPGAALASPGVDATDEALALVKEQRRYLYLFGRATYRSALGERRRTDWCVQLVAPALDYSRPHTDVIAASPIPCRRHNCTDAACEAEDGPVAEEGATPRPSASSG